MPNPASRRPLPSYLAVVPPPGKRFKRPKPAAKPLPITEDEAASLTRQSDYVEKIIDALMTAASSDNPITTLALARSVSLEVGMLICKARRIARNVSPDA